MKPRAVALIPARAGSKRVRNKNIRPLCGHPMLAYSIRAAIDSGVFDAIICATDSEQYADVARHYGAEVPFMRSAEISGDKSPDIEWVVWMLKTLKESGRDFEIFSILRPTNPFRQPETIRRAWSCSLRIRALIPARHWKMQTTPRQDVGRSRQAHASPPAFLQRHNPLA
jgi:N-acylneuraminate cytidylyltransferase